MQRWWNTNTGRFEQRKAGAPSCNTTLCCPRSMINQRSEGGGMILGRWRMWIARGQCILVLLEHTKHTSNRHDRHIEV